MAHVVPYINFADQSREAIEFYKGVFGGEAEVSLVKDSPAASQMPPEWADRVMHFDFKAGDIHFLGSDIISDQAGKVVGNVFAMAVTCDSAEQVHEYLDKLSAGGKVNMPAGDSPWGGTYGECNDKYGLRWMIDYTAPQQ